MAVGIYSPHHRILLFVRVKLIEAVLPHVAPSVVRAFHSLYWECCLLFIEQHLHPDVLVVDVMTIEYELDIATHREYLVVIPVVILQFVRMHSLAISVEVEQTSQWQHHGLMTEAQCGSWFVESDARVSLRDDFTEQVALGERLDSAIKFARTKLAEPSCVVSLP